MSSIASIVVAFITGVMGPVTVILIKTKLNKQKIDPITYELQISEIVTNKIEEIRESKKADRVWITQFHNGGNFYPTGKSIAKFSMIYETVNVGVFSIQQNFQNIPVNIFSKSINRLLSKDIIEIPDYQDQSIATYGLKYIAEESNCKSSYLFSIKSIDDKFIGMLGVEYTRRKVKLDNEDITNISSKASAIGAVLMNHKV